VDAALWVLAILLTAVLVYYSFFSVPAIADSFTNADKVFHALAFASTVGAYLFAGVWRPGRGRGRFSWAAPAIVSGAIVTTILIEVLQGAFFHRDAQILDAVAGSLGALSALGSWGVVRVAFG
jgi:hypothetical protein